MPMSVPLEIHVAGDVCLDVVGVPVPPPAIKDPQNWKMTGEMRTDFLLGGAMLLAQWVRDAISDAKVHATQAYLPTALACGEVPKDPLTADQFLRIAERLNRDEIVHSLLGLDGFPAAPDEEQSVMRVKYTHGFSGPKSSDPSLKLAPPKGTGAPQIIVLDDTGNRFRADSAQWPAAIKDADNNSRAVVVHKLHRPLPVEGGSTNRNELWAAVQRRFKAEQIVVVSISDLRDLGAPINQGLSWERTALDVVWQLLNFDAFTELSRCPHLVVRMGLDGAVYLRRHPSEEDRYDAWLIYDPAGIEGTAASSVSGHMVGYGSVFTAALVKEVGQLLTDHGEWPDSMDAKSLDKISACICNGARQGLTASRRLLKSGFGDMDSSSAKYPGTELFSGDDDTFACQPIRMIPHATVPDRGYWRLLDAVFANQTEALNRAVTMVATSAKPTSAEDVAAEALLKQAPVAQYADLQTYDRRETENYRALYALFLDYLSQPKPPRPLSVAVFGPPGAGKSFGAKMVAKALGQMGGARKIETLTFNLSQYQTPEQLYDAFHLVRDLVLRGRLPLVFFDEFDTSLAEKDLGWLRYFLAPMQDGEFLDRGTPHPIGPAIFLFAGGTSHTYADFAKATDNTDFVAAKGPDFLSRLRGTLDVPGLDLDAPCDVYGPVDALPCEAAILLRRGGILAYQLADKAPNLRDSDGALHISPTVLRALLSLPSFHHGNRSFEALLDMSRLPGAAVYTPSILPAADNVELHANSKHLQQLLAPDYADARERLAQVIHEAYLNKRREDPAGMNDNTDALAPWSTLGDELKSSNYEQAEHIAVKLRAAGLWFRKQRAGSASDPRVAARLEEKLEVLAKMEHDRWVAEKRRLGWIAAPDQEEASRDNKLLLHPYVYRWKQLSEKVKELDRMTVRNLPKYLDTAGFELVMA